jgi:hypothetical protein
MGRSVFHLRDSEPRSIHSDTATSTCGKRVKKWHTMPRGSEQHVSCVGCKAIIVERAKEQAERLAQPQT